MYASFYGLKQEPFNVTPDPEFLFLSPSHKEALGSIIYGVKQRKGFIVVTGEVGVGKTTILRSYLEGVNRRQLKVIYVFNPGLTFRSLLQTIGQELGIDVRTPDVTTLVSRLHLKLIEVYMRGKNVALLIDEAQNVPVETLENLRMLSNLETSKDKLIQIVLIGQPEFETALRREELRQLRQRVAVHCSVSPLSRRESLAYIDHRLSRAGMKEGAPVFTPGALKKIVRHAKGIPRVINIVADNALVTGFGYRKKRVPPDIVDEVIFDLDGRRSPRGRGWVFASAATLVLLGILFVFSPYRGVLLSRFENPVYYGVIEAAPPTVSKDEGKVEAEVEAAIRTEAAVEAKVENGGQAGGTVETTPVFPVKRVVKEGDTLFRMTMSIYRTVDERILQRVMEENPHLKDAGKIKVGQEIIFPEPPESE